MTSILKDENLQKQLDEDGIVSFPLLDRKEIDYLQNLFFRFHSEADADFLNRYYICLHSPDRAYVEKIHEEVEKIVLPKAKQMLKPFKEMVYTLQMKGVGQKTELMIHQDWSITNENLFKSYTFWIPLVDSYEENGTIYAIRGSHHTMRVLRCGTIPTPFDNIREIVFGEMKPERVKAGHVLIFDSALVHYSPPNKTNLARISAVTNIVPAEAELVLYYKDVSQADSPVEIYAVPDKFYLLYGHLPKEFNCRPAFGTKVGLLENFEFHQFDEAEFKQRILAISKLHNIKT